jgi:hypothetical protein
MAGGPDGGTLDVDVSGLRRGASEHGAAQAAATTLADALRAIRLDPAALGAVDAVPGFAGAVATAARTQADGASAESTHRSDARQRAGTAAGMGRAMIDATTRQARGAPGLPVR